MRLSGISPGKVKTFVYTIAGVLSAVGGIVYLSRVNSGVATMGTSLEMEVITSVVLGGVSVSGGVGKLRGVFIGLLIIGFLLNGMIILGISEYYQWLVKSLVLIMAVALDKNLYKLKKSK